jgi:putative molybdopterin biosynthesis protein
MEILSAKELAAYLKINEKKVYQLARESSIPHAKIGGKIAFVREIIDGWIKEKTASERHLFLAGSDDFLMKKVIDEYNARGGSTIFYAPVGSINGLSLLREKVANISCVHILDMEKKAYTLSYLDRYLSGERYIAIHLYFREQGLYVAKNNPKRISSLHDIAAGTVSFVNRNGGSGTRLLIDFLLHQEKIDAGSIKGYKREVGSHLQAGLAVLRGEADASFGIRHLAHLLDLSFIPLFRERFEMVIPEAIYPSERIRDFLSFFDQGKLMALAGDSTGYDTTETGSIIST